MTPNNRIHILNDTPVNPDGTYVLYWMTSFRRATYNYSLDYAVHKATTLGLPLLVFEGLRTCYPWSSERMHRFVIEGMRNQQDHFNKTGITYLPYVEPARNAGKGLMSALSKSAALVVTDLFPTFSLTHAATIFRKAPKTAHGCR